MRYNGFTLIEVLVAMTVFALILLVSVSAFVYALDLQRRAFNIQQAEENANFVFESMTKEIRISQIIAPLDNSLCPAMPDAMLTIKNSSDETVRYYLDAGNIIREVNGTKTTINSNTIQFSRFDFCVAGATEQDRRQPRVTILAALQTTATKHQAGIEMQTTLSFRELSD